MIGDAIYDVVFGIYTIVSGKKRATREQRMWDELMSAHRSRVEKDKAKVDQQEETKETLTID